MVTRNTAAEERPRAAANADVSSRSGGRRSNVSAALDHHLQTKAQQDIPQSPSSNTVKTPNNTTLKSKKGENGRSHVRITSDKGDDTSPEKSAKKRRKVNHACVYCRRSHMTCDQNRPCSRCVKRDIGHLCHDEPREPKRASGNQDREASNTTDLTQEILTPKTAKDSFTTKDGTFQPEGLAPGVDKSLQTAEQNAQDPGLPGSTVDSRAGAVNTSNQPYYNNGWENTLQQNQLHDLHSFHPNYIFNTSEVTNEYNLINDFLSTSLLDDGSLMGDIPPNMFTDPSFTNLMGPSMPTNIYPPGSQVHQIAPPAENSTMQKGSANSRPSTKKGSTIAKAQEKYYMTAADPAGEAKSEERMNVLLRAKYDAGLLKPFNYIEGYKRLARYMESHLESSSRQRIQRQLEMFRPEFRKRVAELKDIELVGVEMWFETKLMEYDRVFASMAIPACCWRRTGEIFRGNREMAELIKVPVEQLRDGKLAIHEMMSEASLVAYWEKFGSIAFDTTRKAMLTSCWLQTPESALQGNNNEIEGRVAMLKCCFSFTVQRDQHDIPTLIIGNFLPILSTGS